MIALATFLVAIGLLLLLVGSLFAVQAHRHLVRARAIRAESERAADVENAVLETCTPTSVRRARVAGRVWVPGHWQGTTKAEKPYWVDGHWLGARR